MPTLDRLVLALAIGVAGVCLALWDSHIDGLVVWMIAVIVTLYVAQVVRGLLAHARFVWSLRRLAWDGEFAGVSVRFVAGVTPFVAGVLRPRIYCDPRLRARLTSAQQRAVVLHEQYHQRRRDPLRLQLGRALRPLGSLAPAVAADLATREAWYEIAADDYALRKGASRADVASALAAILDIDGVQFAPGFASAVELRVRALAGDMPALARGRWPVYTRFALATAVLALCVLVV